MKQEICLEAIDLRDLHEILELVFWLREHAYLNGTTGSNVTLTLKFGLSQKAIQALREFLGEE